MRSRIILFSFLFLLPMNSALAEDKITVLLDWFVNPDHATLIVAQEKGYFKKYGLDVELIAPADPSDPPKLVAAGKADLAISYQPQLHLQVSQGLPLTRVGTLVATPLNCLVVLKGGPIKTLSDLKGKKIGYSVSGVEDAMLKVMLEPNGVKLSDVELINVNFSLSPSLLSGQVDAVIGAFRNFELNQMDIEGYPGKAFYPEEEGVPAYDELIVIANSKKLSDPRLKDFMLALEDAVQFLVNHPDESWKLFIKKHKELDDDLNKRAWADTLPRFALRPAALDTGRYNRFAQFMLEQGLIKQVPPVQDYAIALD
jgi:putative hydroxymethylpyrimidine transport system substrate-binding protein